MPLPLHPAHMASLAAIGLVVVFAIAATASTWTKGVGEYDSGAITYTATLWRQKLDAPGAEPSEAAWSDTLDNDQPYCPGSETPTKKDVLQKIRAAQAGAIMSIVSAVIFGIVGLVYALGKLRRKFLLLMAALLLCGFGMMAFFGYNAVYNACPRSTCETFVALWMLSGAKSASCGSSTGIGLVWASLVFSAGAFAGFLVGAPLKLPPGLAARRDGALAQPLSQQTPQDRKALPSAKNETLPAEEEELANL